MDMRTYRRLFSILVLGLSIALSTGTHAQGSDEPPYLFPITPDAAECRISPRSVERTLALIALATPETSTREAPYAIVPKGTPADASTVAGVIATVREFVACVNAGDFPRAFTLFTEDGFKRFSTSSTPPTEEEIRVLFEVNPEDVATETPASLVAVTDISDLADGRVGAFAVIDDATESPPMTTSYLVFARTGERWLIDDILEFDSDERRPGVPREVSRETRLVVLLQDSVARVQRSPRPVTTPQA
jgi:hypothetical protein